MKTKISTVLLSLIFLGCQNKQNPGLRQGKFYTEAQGNAEQSSKNWNLCISIKQNGKHSSSYSGSVF